MGLSSWNLAAAVVAVGVGVGMNGNIFLPLVGIQYLWVKGTMPNTRMEDKYWEEEEEEYNGEKEDG